MLVNCVAYQEGKKLAEISIEQISTYLALKDCFVWVALKDPSPEEMAKMQEEFNLHPLAVEDANHGHQRTKIEEYEDSIFAVCHLMELDQDGEIKLGEVNIFVGSNYVLTVRNQASHGFAPVRKRCEQEPKLLSHGSAFVFYALLDDIVDSYSPVIQALQTQLEDVEDTLFDSSSSPKEIIHRLYSLKKQLHIAQHVILPFLESTSRLFGGRIPVICAGMQDYYRDIYDHLLRLRKILDICRETITTAIQVSLSMITLSESEVTKKLGSYAALFAIPTMIAGIYGMNFQHMPELTWTYGYPLSLLLMGGIDFLLWRQFKRIGWI